MTDAPAAPFDILITGGILLTMSPAAPLIAPPVVGIRDGVIRLVRERGMDPLPAARDVIDASGCLIMPGLVNTHTHAAMVCFRGLADDLPLMSWLQEHIFPAEARHVSPAMVAAGARLAMAEMILAGTTTCCDVYFFAGSTGEAALQAGMRAVIGQGFLDVPAPDVPDPSRHGEVARAFLEHWRGRSPLVLPALCCHSPYTCSPATLQAVKDAARGAGVPYVIHVAETQDEVQTIRRQHRRSPVGHLDELGVLDAGTLAVHCNWVDDDDLDVLARTRTAVSHNPESNMKLAAGLAPVPAMLERGVRVGLGTDGCASNNDLDMFREMGTAARAHKVNEMNPTVMDAATVLRMATLGGAEALGLAAGIGSIEVGKWADIIIVDARRPHLTPLHNCRSQLVYAASGADVATSIIQGRVVMRDRRLLTIDVGQAMEEVRSIGRRIHP